MKPEEIFCGQTYQSGDSECQRKVLSIIYRTGGLELGTVRFMNVQHFDTAHLGQRGEMSLLRFSRWANRMVSNA